MAILLAEPGFIYGFTLGISLGLIIGAIVWFKDIFQLKKVKK